MSVEDHEILEFNLDVVAAITPVERISGVVYLQERSCWSKVGTGSHACVKEA